MGKNDRDKSEVWLTNTTQGFNGTATPLLALTGLGASLVPACRTAVQERQRKIHLLTRDTHICFVFPLFSSRIKLQAEHL